jgi:N6-adenosine-specific RNA methylase IME4
LKAAVLRRHLTDDQRAVMAAMWAKENRKPTGAAAHKDKSYPTGVSVGKAALQPALASASATVKVPITRAVRAAEVLRKSPALAKQVHSGEIPLKQAIKNIRLEEQEKAILAHTPAEGVFDVIVVDPPWPYEKRSGDITHRGACPYPTMSLEEIRALKIPAASDCILWLWTTNAFMREAFTLLDAWGFQEKTILTWFKDSMGLGDWLRGKTEHCILAVRGKPFHVLTNQTTALQGPRREHSRKPDEFFALAELISPHGRRLEMFAREERPGWTSCGAEMGQFP